MTRRLAAAAVALAAVAGSVFVAGPAQAAPGCTQFGFCLHDTSSSNPFAFYSAGVPRNTCVTGFTPNITSFITNNTSVQWWVFHTGNCSGAHGAMLANIGTDLTSYQGGAWNNNIQTIMRTSSL